MKLRIVSLIASSTEIVAALGLESKLVGRSHECDFPKGVTALPVCTRPRFDTALKSGQIDRQVKALVEQALSVYEVDIDMIARLGPTHIITQSQCEVCAVSLSLVEQALSELVSSHPEAISLSPNNLSDIWQDIHRIGLKLGCMPAAVRLVESLEDKMRQIYHQAKQSAIKPKLAFIEWIQPLMMGSNWMPELIGMAFAEPYPIVEGQSSYQIRFEDLADFDPDIILVAPCGFNIERTLIEMPELAGNKGWGHLNAVKTGQVYLADGNQYFNRPGPRILESLQILAEIVHPDLFDFGHRDIAFKLWAKR